MSYRVHREKKTPTKTMLSVDIADSKTYMTLSIVTSKTIVRFYFASIVP